MGFTTREKSATAKAAFLMLDCRNVRRCIESSRLVFPSLEEGYVAACEDRMKRSFKEG
jgi:hypothetical protein